MKTGISLLLTVFVVIFGIVAFSMLTVFAVIFGIAALAPASERNYFYKVDVLDIQGGYCFVCELGCNVDGSGVADLVIDFDEHKVYTLGRIFHKEILFIQEVPVLFVTYMDIQGVITEVVYILTETQDGFVIEHNNGRNEELERSFMDAVIDASDRRMADFADW